MERQSLETEPQQQSSSNKLITWEAHDRVAVLTLNQPDRRNVLSRRLVEEALDALDASRATCRAVVITGAGDFFCAGADAAELAGSGAPPSLDEANPLDLFEALDREPRPVVGAVNGPALGGGVELTLVCDAVIAVSSARFSLPEVGLGVVPNTALVLLPRIVGFRRALELIHGRASIDAETAMKWGLVSAIAEANDAVAMALAEAQRRCDAAPPTALATSRRATRPDSSATWAQIRGLMAEISWPEAMEGMTAFMERRPPDYDSFWQA